MKFDLITLIVWYVFVFISGGLAVSGWAMYFFEKQRKSRRVTNPIANQKNHPDIITDTDNNVKKDNNALHIG